ncbi:MAG: tetratricopeptide repeat protein [Gammaproteobacteria bacterium]
MKKNFLIAVTYTLAMTGCAVNHLGEGMSAGRNRDYAEMLRHCSEAARLPNADPLAFKCIGEAELNLGHTQAAEEAYLTYLGQIPSDMEARFALINIYLSTGRYPAAQAHLEAVINMQPGNIQAIYLLGESHRLMGNCDAALLNYDRALDINPNFTDAALAKAKAEAEICAIAKKKNAVNIKPKINKPKIIKQKKFQAGGAALDESDW